MCFGSKPLEEAAMAGKNKKWSFGPGFLVTAAFIGPGTVTTCTLAGARFGTALLFALVFATVTTVILQEMTARLSLGSGLDLAQALRELPSSSLTRGLLAVITLAAITFGCAAYEAGNIIGGALGLEAITSLPHKIWVAFISILAAAILASGRYKVVEKILIVLVFLMSLSFLTAFILARPDLSAISKGFIPSFPSGSLPLILALIGTTVVPYNLFLHSAAVRQKWKGKEQLGTARLDIVLSVTLGGLISMAIVLTSAAAFFGTNADIQNGIQMAGQLKPLFGNLSNILFGLGFFAAGLTSSLTAPYAAAFASSGVLGWKGGIRSWKFRAVWAGVVAAGFCVSLFDLKPLAVILFAQVANGIILPIAVVFLLLVLNRRSRMGGLANSRLQNIVGGGIIAVVSFLGLWNILKLFLK